MNDRKCSSLFARFVHSCSLIDFDSSFDDILLMVGFKRRE